MNLFQSAEGVQIFLELVDDDFTNTENEFLDRFAINVTIPAGSTVTANYSGIFGVATVNISLTLQCSETYYDASCDRFCEDNCTCGPGLTGPFCTIDIDDCVSLKSCM